MMSLFFKWKDNVGHSRSLGQANMFLLPYKIRRAAGEEVLSGTQHDDISEYSSSGKLTTMIQVNLKDADCGSADEKCYVCL